MALNVYFEDVFEAFIFMGGNFFFNVFFFNGQHISYVCFVAVFRVCLSSAMCIQSSAMCSLSPSGIQLDPVALCFKFAHRTSCICTSL